MKRDIEITLNVSPTKLEAAWAELIPELGRGRLTTEQFWTLMGESLHRAVPEMAGECLLCRSLRSRLRPHYGAARVARRLGSRGPIVAMTNAVPCHVQVLDHLGVYRPFQTVLTSFELGIRKPDERLFDFALAQIEQPPEAVLYIDDQPHMLDIPRRMGLQVIQFTTAAQLVRDLAGRGVPKDHPRWARRRNH